ncbi:MAG: accessory factor UbiK family protein [Rhizobiaceae bacterium]
MSNGTNRILDEFAKMMTDAAGAAQGVRREVEGAFRAQGEKLLNSMDLVKREEFDAVMEMAANARAHNEAQAAQLAALEARIAALEPGGTAPVAKKSAAKTAKA